MDIWKWISGTIHLELTSAEPEEALSSISSREISLFQLEKQGDLTWSFWVSRKDWAALQTLCEKRGDTLKIIKQNGLFFLLSSFLHHKLLVLGAAAFLMLSLFLPTRILVVRVEGNLRVPSRKILAAAEEAGIGFGASRREVRSEKVKNRLLSSIPQLQWAGVNTAGCIATVSVREQAQPENEATLPEITNIIAARDGYILSATATEGTLLVQPGQTVTAGQILISGYTDCGICIRGEQSSGEVFAQTYQTCVSITPSKWMHRINRAGSTKKISLLWRKKRINLWKGSGNVSPLCDRMYEEYYVTLPGGFSLPFGLCVETLISYDTVPMEADAGYAEKALSAFTRKHLTANMIAGQILEQEEQVTLAEGIYRLTGTYVCSEMIGRVQQEQIGDQNGKIS